VAVDGSGGNRRQTTADGGDGNWLTTVAADEGGG
jgi:hypothetical protein